MHELILQKDHDDALAITNNPDVLSGLSDEELLGLRDKSKSLYNFFFQMQMVTKELCNSVYGGVATNSLRYFNPNTAMDITAEGRHSNQMMERVSWGYFKNVWHKDFEFHKELIERFPNIMRLEPTPVLDDPTVYGDTDSVVGETMLRTSLGQMPISDAFDKSTKAFISMDGSEHRTFSGEVLNWSRNRGVHLAKPKTIIRHKVSKAKWKMVTKSGKEIIITGDHSLVVFRGGQKLKIKAKDINIATDKVLVVNYE